MFNLFFFFFWEGGGGACYESRYNAAVLWEVVYDCVMQLMSHECCGIR